jgi:hypothetical protein
MRTNRNLAAEMAAYVNSRPWVQQFVSLLKSRVDQVFAEQEWTSDDLAINPIVEGMFVYGDDPIAPQKDRAYRALLAREDFWLNGPADSPPFPVSYSERESLKIGGLPHIVAWFARSLEGRNYDLREHPTFETYARGVMASDATLDDIKNNQELRRRFPPRRLLGLGPGLCWKPPCERRRP